MDLLLFSHKPQTFCFIKNNIFMLFSHNYHVIIDKADEVSLNTSQLYL